MPTKKSARVQQAWHSGHQMGNGKEKAPVRVTERQNRGLLRSRSHPLLMQEGLWKVVFPISKLPSLSCTSCRQSSQLTLKRAGDGDRSYLASKDQRDAHHNTVLWAIAKFLSRQKKFLSLNRSANRDLTWLSFGIIYCALSFEAFDFQCYFIDLIPKNLKVENPNQMTLMSHVIT